jgi:hypothetical protein
MRESKSERKKKVKNHRKLESKFWAIGEERAKLVKRIDAETNELKKKALSTQLRAMDAKLISMSKTVEKSYFYNNIIN